MDKIKTLSQAIRFGAKLKPQARGRVCRLSSFEDQLETCAIGAAWDAVRVAQGLDSLDTLDTSTTSKEACHLIKQRIGCDFNTVIRVPGLDMSTILSLAIITLNDKFYWSREAIADWLESEGL